MRLAGIGLGFVLLAAAFPASGIVIRHDVADSEYLVPDEFYPPLVVFPIEGHGVLIADQWVVTAAHVARLMGHPVQCVTIGGKPRAVADVIVHPGYRPLPPIEGDAAPFMAIQLERDDIALLRLAEPVKDVDPAIIYRGEAEQGKIGKIIGKGATGDG